MPEQGSTLQKKTYYSIILLYLFITGLILLLNSHSFLLFHSVSEIFTIVIGFTIFILFSHTRAAKQDYLFSVIAISYFFIAAVDTLHLLAYKGMSVFESSYPGANLATQLWLIGRYILALALLIAPFFSFIKRRLIYPFLFFFFLLLTTTLLISVFVFRNFPAAYLEGIGLTTFKIYSEYAIIAVLSLSIFFVLLFKSRISSYFLYSLLISIFFNILAEFSFTRYVSVYSGANALGHFFKMLSYVFLLRGTLISVLIRPSEVLYKELFDSEDKFRKVINTALDARIISDASGKINLWNSAAERMFGYSEKEALGKPITIIMPAKYRELHKVGITRVASGGPEKIIGKSIEIEGLKKNGAVFPIEITLTKEFIGGKLNFIAVIRNITERKKGREVLEKRDQELSLMNKFMVGRELKMTELKEEIDRLRKIVGGSP